MQNLSLPDLGESIPLRHLYEVLWRRGDLEFLLWQQQEPVWEALKRIPPGIVEFVVLCARQFGKSTIGVLRALSQAIKHRDCCILIMGPDINQTKDIVLPKMRFLTQTAPEGLIVQSRAENRFRIFHDLDRTATDYSEIVIGGMNKNSSSQRGKTVQEILVEEIADLAEDDFMQSMEQDLGPALTHSKGGKIVYLTTLPPVPDHPFITDTMVKAELNHAIKIFTIDDNKALTQEQYDACVERSGGKDTVAFQREYLCIVVRDRNKVVLPDWIQAKNVGAVFLPDYLFMHTTIDWGGVRDKTCAVLHYYDYLRDEDVFWDERVFEPNTPSTVIVDEVKLMELEFLKVRESHKIESRFIDAPHQFVYVDLIRPPYDFTAAIPNKLDWIAGINVLNNRFKTGKAIIHSRCKFLILSARSGMFNDKKTDLARSQALGHCDGIMAMSYALRMRATQDPYPFSAMRSGQYPLQNSSQTALVQSSSELAVVPKAFGKFRR